MKAATLLAVSLGTIFAIAPARADIVPTPNDTNTTVTPQGNRLDIGGGARSADGTNLFHSFSQFNLDAGQIANFLADPALSNILSRINSGQASIINGLIQITGGSPNLYLLNPSGVIFGPSARLNVPASFIVTTATRVGFGDNNWFQAFGDNQYATLGGNPDRFAFANGQSGTILNAGQLTVGTGQTLALLGATTISTGQLHAPGGSILVKAIPGTQVVHLQLPGHILSLEVPAEAIADGLHVDELPVLLAGSDLPVGLTAAPDGTVTLDATDTQIPTTPGTAIVSGSIDVSSPDTGGTAYVLGDRVGVLDAQIDASGTRGGGDIFLGGGLNGVGLPAANLTVVDAGTRIAADALQTGDGGRIVAWSKTATAFAGAASARGGTIAGDGGWAEFSSAGQLQFTGRFDLAAPQGTPGNVLFDPTEIRIVAAGTLPNNDVELDDGIILAGDGGPVPFVITETAILDAFASRGVGTVSLAATADIFVETPLIAATPPIAGTGTLAFIAPQISLGADIRLEGISLNFMGDVRLTADVALATRFDDALTAGDTILLSGRIDGPHQLEIVTDLVGIAGPVGVLAPLTGLAIASNRTSIGSLGAETVVAVDGPIAIDGNLQAAGPLSATGTEVEILGDVSLQQGFSDGPTGSSGLSLQATAGGVEVGNIAPTDSGGAIATVGPVAIAATEDISTGTISALGTGGNGPVDILSENGTLAIRDIEAEAISLTGSVVLGEDVTLAAAGTDGTTAENTVVITGSVEGDNALAIAAGFTGLSGPIGADTPLASLTVTSPQASIGTFGAGTSASANGPIVLSGDLNVAGPLDLTGSSIDIGGTITLQPGIEGATSDLRLTATDGDVNAGDIAPTDTGGTPSTGPSLAIEGNALMLGDITTTGTDSSGSVDLLGRDGDVTVGAITTGPGGPVDIQSPNGSISSAAIQTGGSAVTVTAANDIDLPTDTAISTANDTGDGGPIDINSDSGNVRAGDVDSSSTDGAGGPVTARAPVGTIAIGDINSSSDNGAGGNVTVFAPTGLSVGAIDSTGADGASGVADVVGPEEIPDREDTTTELSSIRAAEIFLDGDFLLVEDVELIALGMGGPVPTDTIIITGNITGTGNLNIEAVGNARIVPAGRIAGDINLGIEATNDITVGEIVLGSTEAFGTVRIASDSGVIEVGDIGAKAIALAGAVTLTEDLTLTATNGTPDSTPDNRIAIDGSIDGAQHLTLTAGSIGLSGPIGTSEPPTSLTATASSTDLGAPVPTPITIAGPVRIEGNLNTLGSVQLSGIAPEGSDDPAAIAIQGDVALHPLPPESEGSSTGNSALSLIGEIGDIRILGAISPGSDGPTPDLTITGDNLNLGDITTTSTANSGTVDLLARTGDLSVGAIDAGDATTILAPEGNIAGSTIRASGSDVFVRAANEIDLTQEIAGTGIFTTNALGNGGNITVESANGNIALGAIDSSSATGAGGTVAVTAENGFVRVTSTNPGAADTSIFSGGATTDGAITVTHGGNGAVPFIIGDATTNGSVGPFQNNTFNIPAGTYFGDEIVGNVAILTDAPEGPAITGVSSETIVEINQDLAYAVQLAGEQSAQASQDTSSATASAGGQAILTSTEITGVDQAKLTLTEIENSTGIRPALIYVNFVPAALGNNEDGSVDIAQREAQLTRTYEQYYDLPEAQPGFDLSVPPDPTDRLELILVTPGSDPQRFVVPTARRDEVLALARRLYARTSTPFARNYLPVAQELYNLILAPLEPTLTAEEIGNLVFILPEGLRLLPLAVLHDGEQFLVERFSSGLAPSLSLTDTRYQPLQDLKVFAAGASNFADENALGPLPAVEVEVAAIANRLWDGESILNETFTVEEFKARRRSAPTGIIHLATHADFKRESPGENYIQFFDRRLQMDEIRELELNSPPVELMVLSACRTGFGDADVELGFGGLAVQAGAKTVVASLWYVGDTGTLALMTEFYSQLATAEIKADALRAAQIAMLSGEVTARDGQIESARGSLPIASTQDAGTTEDLTHPFYWAAFTTIGSPW